MNAFQKITLATILATAGCAGQETQPEKPKQKIFFDISGNVVKEDIKIEATPANKAVDQSNPYDIISSGSKVTQPKETTKPLEQLKEPKYLQITVNAEYKFEKDGFGAGTVYGIIKNYNMTNKDDRAKALQMLLDADTSKDRMLSDKKVADYIAKNKLTVKFERNSPVESLGIQGTYEVEESIANQFNKMAEMSPARVLYHLGDSKRVDKQALKDLEDKLK